MANIPENPSNPPSEVPLSVVPITESGLPPNIAAGLAECFSIVGGLVFYFVEAKNPLVRFHALQSAYLGALGILFGMGLSVVLNILALIPIIGWLTALLLIFATPILGIVFGVIWIIAVIQAFNGKEWEMPWLGKLVRRHLAEGKFFFLKIPGNLSLK